MAHFRQLTNLLLKIESLNDMKKAMNIHFYPLYNPMQSINRFQKIPNMYQIKTQLLKLIVFELGIFAFLIKKTKMLLYPQDINQQDF